MFGFGIQSMLRVMGWSCWGVPAKTCAIMSRCFVGFRTLAMEPDWHLRIAWILQPGCVGALAPCSTCRNAILCRFWERCKTKHHHFCPQKSSGDYGAWPGFTGAGMSLGRLLWVILGDDPGINRYQLIEQFSTSDLEAPHTCFCHLVSRIIPWSIRYSAIMFRHLNAA